MIPRSNIINNNPYIPAIPESVYCSSTEPTVQGYTKQELTTLNIRFSQHQLSKHQQNLINNQSHTYGYQQNLKLYNRWLSEYKPKLHEFDVNLVVNEDAASVKCCHIYL